MTSSCSASTLGLTPFATNIDLCAKGIASNRTAFVTRKIEILSCVCLRFHSRVVAERFDSFEHRHLATTTLFGAQRRENCQDDE
jgi:hypothetical protein